MRTELKAKVGEAMFRVLVRPLGKSGENDTVCDVRIVRKVKTPQLKQQVGHGLGCGQVYKAVRVKKSVHAEHVESRGQSSWEVGPKWVRGGHTASHKGMCACRHWCVNRESDDLEDNLAGEDVTKIYQHKVYFLACKVVKMFMSSWRPCC